jgi:hypothetical protein
MQNIDIGKRLSVRRVAMMLGIPARVVARAVASGELPALRTKTETGRDRAYILYEDAQEWLLSLQQETSVAK